MEQPAHPPEYPVRVLLVAEPGRDGVFRYVEALARFLMGQSDVEVHLAYSTVRGSPALDELVAHLVARGSKTLDLRVDNAPGAADLRAFWRLQRLAREVQPTVIHAHSSKAGVLSRGLTLAGTRSRVFYTPHAYFQMHGPPSPRRRAFHAVERVLSRVGLTVHTSPSEAEYARRELGVPADRQTVLPNGADCDLFHPARDRAETLALRARLGLPDDDMPLLGTVARFSAQKDPLTLLRGVLPALAQAPGWRFVHLGRGELEAEADALLATAPPQVRARVLRLPALSAPAEFYRALDGFTLPSRYEGFSLAALEATATNLPLILSCCPGNTDLDGQGLNRLRWCSPGNPATLTEQILGWVAETRSSSPVPIPACNHREVALTRFNLNEAHRQLLVRYRRQAGCDHRR